MKSEIKMVATDSMFSESYSLVPTWSFLLMSSHRRRAKYLPQTLFLRPLVPLRTLMTEAPSKSLPPSTIALGASF